MFWWWGGWVGVSIMLVAVNSMDLICSGVGVGVGWLGGCLKNVSCR